MAIETVPTVVDYVCDGCGHRVSSRQKEEYDWGEVTTRSFGKDDLKRKELCNLCFISFNKILNNFLQP